ncbi:MAG: hypothetical protein M1305_00870 [Candidatus Marsarchaeota archaeon]|nr:hypothetical protein [Candidatus Marsarchaeota archaeon]
MILFCDEDLGEGVPQALRSVHLDVQWVLDRYKPDQRNKRVEDVRWLTDAGRNRWLALSCNKKILTVQHERETIEREKVGIVFLTTGQEDSVAVLRLVLNKWTWLQAIDEQIDRPFAYLMTIKGHVSKAPVI